MLFATPSPDAIEMEVLGRIGEIRSLVHVQSEGPDASSALVAPLFVEPAPAPPPDPEESPERAGDARALGDYLLAMKYVLALHDDPDFAYQEGFVRAVHFMMLAHAGTENPGRWRTGPMCVHRRSSNEVVYEAPPAATIPALVGELMARLNAPDGAPPLFRAALAHLNLVKIHPFADGNGRIARALHTLVLVREGIVDPEFCSLEYYLAQSRSRYFEALSDVGFATWSPEEDARPFVRFCLTAHLHQAERLLEQAQRLGRVWADAERAIERSRLPRRLVGVLADAASFGAITPASCRRWIGGGRPAARDLRALIDHGGLIARQQRSRAWQAGPLALEIRRGAWAAFPPRPLPDPFARAWS